MSERGVFAVDRGIWDHPGFADEPFTEREAWQWLIGDAAFKERIKRVGSVVVTLQRGQCANSTRFLQERWKWGSETRVRRFLERRKIAAEIVVDTDAGVTVVTICNYNKYQRVSLPSVADIDAPGVAAASQQRRKIEDTETKETDSEAKASGADAPVYTDSRHELWGEGVPILKSMGVSEKDARGNIGRWLKTMRDDAQGVLSAIQRARDNRVHGPIPWITNALKGPQYVNANSPPRANQTTGAAQTRDSAVIAGMGRALNQRRADRAAAKSSGDELRGQHSGPAGEPDAEPDATAGDGRSSRQLTLLAAGNG